MKITSVRFLNLNSLQGEHLIRFDEPPLSESGLFAIIGPTGAGKTTILDAITVALYGQVPRHGRDVAEIMTRHTGECWSEVEFVAQDKTYRARWSLRRSRSKPDGKLQNNSMELIDASTQEVLESRLTETKQRIVDLCGLDFQQFLRSVMLSQGDFTRFLKATESERSELLEKLTDTRIYSQISKAAYEKAKEETQKLQDLTRLLQLDQLLPQETRAALTQETHDLKAQAQQTHRLVQQHYAEKTWLENLAKLRQKESQLQTEKSTGQEAAEKFLPQREKLQRHEQALPFQSDLSRLEEVQRHGLAHTQAIQQLQAQIPTQQEQVALQAEQVQTARQTQQEAQATLQEAEPRLDQVLQLDTSLAGQQAQLQKEEAASVALRQQVQELAAGLVERQGQLNAFQAQEQHLTQWLATHAQDQELTDSIAELKSEARSLREVRAQHVKATKEKNENELVLQKEAENAHAWQTKLEETEKSLKEQSALLQELKEQANTLLQGQEPDALENLCQQLPSVCSQLEKQLDISRRFLLLENKRQELQQQLGSYTQNLHQKRQAVTSSSNNRAVAQEKLGHLQQIVDLQRQIQQYEEARNQLQPQQPCPLCGSLHHPLVEEHQPLTLTDAQQNLQAQQARVQELDKEERTLAAEVHRLEVATQHAQTQVEDLAMQAQQLQSQFAQLNTALALAHDIAVSDSIDMYWNTRKAELNQATRTLEQLRQLRTRTEKAREQEQHLLSDQQRFRHEIEKTAEKCSLAQAQISRLQEELTDLSEQEEVFTQTITSYFSTYGLTYTGTNGQELLNLLEERRQTFEQKKEEVPQVRENYLQAKAEVENGLLSKKEKEKELAQLEGQLTTLQTQLRELRQQRNSLLPQHLQPQEERTRLQENLQKTTQALQNLEAGLQSTRENLNLLQHTLDSKAKEQDLNQQTQAQVTSALQSKLQPLGFSSILELKEMLLLPEEARQLRAEQDLIQKKQNEVEHALEQTLAELSSEKERHLTELTIEELLPLIQTLEEEKNGLFSQIARLDMQLQQDLALQEKYRQLTKEIETQKGEADRWERLSRLIGSADGKKFSKYAQSLTLARLVELGNRHLLRLNDRYRILKSQENELELQIMDTYQGDAVRSVNSLSGGESFLVSLALALGLSDLASHKAQIHSLFIDEGFGTLDADTLDIAMDALESLQASGKMIGIISHVDALKERISTQIVVEKQAGGRSSIKVRSGNVLA